MADLLVPVRKPTQAEVRRARDLTHVSALDLRLEVREQKWHLPVAIEKMDLGPNPEMEYLRKSSDDANKQTLSIPAQRKEILKLRGYEVAFSWWETLSATTFDNRVAFTRLLEFCRLNPQPLDENAKPTGVIWAYDYDRFSRQQIVINGELKPHTKEMVRVLLEFERYGWRWHFVKSPPTGHELGDMIVSTVRFEQAANYSSVLSGHIRKNKDLKTIGAPVDEGGYWMGGTPPYGAVRVDAVTGRVLGVREWVQPEHGVVLAPDPAAVSTWELAARMVQDGQSLMAVADHLNAIGAPLGPTMLDWNVRNLRRILTNEALIGWPIYRKHKPDVAKAYRAKWTPVVDEELWLAVNAILSKKRKRGEPKIYGVHKPLLPICPYCEAIYQTHHVPNGRRVYKHPSPRTAINNFEWRKVAEAKGCKTWLVDAEQIERAVMDLIRAARLSPEWRAQMEREFRRQEKQESTATLLEAQAKQAYDEAKRAYEAAQERLYLIEDPGVFADFQRKLVEKRNEVERRKLTWKQAQGTQLEVEDDWSRLRKKVDESAQLLSAWESGDLSVRRALFDYWVESIEVLQVEPPAPKHKRRASRYKGLRMAKRLAVQLYNTPEGYQLVDLKPVRSNGGDSGSVWTSVHSQPFVLDLESNLGRTLGY